VSVGLEARLRAPLRERSDFGEILPRGWGSLPALDLARTVVYLEESGATPLGELFDVTGSPGGRIRFTGKLDRADRLAAGLSEGVVIVEGSVGNEAGLGMAGGVLDIKGNAGVRAGGAPPGFKRGMLGGELIVRGSAAAEAGSYMRRGLLVVTGQAGDRAGLGMIAGTVVVAGTAGSGSGLWSKRGSVVALGTITPPPTYAYACTYQPIHLRFLLGRLRREYGLPIQRRHITGRYRRFSGDMAELGKGEILQWTGN
jgi:formylmethanofuran dehydrogenase subunit C